MSLLGKLEVDVEIKASAAKFHDVFSARPHHVSNICPDKIQGCGLHEGDWGKVGTVVNWNYVHDGKDCVAKEVIEAVDDEKNSITFRVIEGDLRNEYKSFVIHIQATQKDEGSLVHWILEYEKLNEQVAHPETLLEFVKSVSQDIDSHLCKA